MWRAKPLHVFLERFMKDIKSLFEGKIKGVLIFGKDIEKKYLSDFIGARVGHAEMKMMYRSS